MLGFPVAKEIPEISRFVYLVVVRFGKDDGVRPAGRLDAYLSERVRKEALAVEALAFAASHSVHAEDEDPVRRGRRRHHPLPFLRGSEGRRRRRYYDLRALQGERPEALREEHVPAKLDADPAVLRVYYREAQVAGGEVVFLAPEGDVRDVHLAVSACNASVRVYYEGGVIAVVAVFFEDRADEDRAAVTGYLPHFRYRRAVLRLRQREAVLARLGGEPRKVE